MGSGRLPGPDLYLTTPYLEGAPSAFLQLHPLKDAALEARAFVEYWHSVGFTSVKAYMDVKPDELRGGNRRGAQARNEGHWPSSVGYNEAAEMGIDNLEHGPYDAPDGELYSKKKPGVSLDHFSGYFGMLAENQKYRPGRSRAAQDHRHACRPSRGRHVHAGRIRRRRFLEFRAHGDKAKKYGS